MEDLEDVEDLEFITAHQVLGQFMEAEVAVMGAMEVLEEVVEEEVEVDLAEMVEVMGVEAVVMERMLEEEAMRVEAVGTFVQEEMDPVAADPMDMVGMEQLIYRLKDLEVVEEVIVRELMVFV